LDQSEALVSTRFFKLIKGVPQHGQFGLAREPALKGARAVPYSPSISISARLFTGVFRLQIQ
jgi:hypothetical protein